MAAARKNYARTKARHLAQPNSEQFEKACFMADLLDGTIEATDMQEQRNGNGRLIRLTYNDPTG